MENAIEQEKVKINKSKKTRVIPGFRLTMGITVTMLSLIVLIPLASVMVYSLKISPSEFIELVTKPNVLYAFATSIGCSFIAAVINVIFGVILAWTLVKYDFPGKRLLDGFIELPFALPTAVAGITLSKMYSDTGMLGAPLAKLGIKVSYTHLGIIIAFVFVGIPFVVRNVQPVLEKLDGQYEEAAYILGASPSKTFFKVILPELRPSILTGFGLAFARGIGEYGSVIYISGKPMLTTINLPREEMGRFTVELLVDRIRGRHQNVMRLEIEGNLVVRDSCAPVDETYITEYCI